MIQIRQCVTWHCLVCLRITLAKPSIHKLQTVPSVQSWTHLIARSGNTPSPMFAPSYPPKWDHRKNPGQQEPFGRSNCDPSILRCFLHVSLSKKRFVSNVLVHHQFPYVSVLKSPFFRDSTDQTRWDSLKLGYPQRIIIIPSFNGLKLGVSPQTHVDLQGIHEICPLAAALKCLRFQRFHLSGDVYQQQEKPGWLPIDP